jgi:hypothetical protein
MAKPIKTSMKAKKDIKVPLGKKGPGPVKPPTSKKGPGRIGGAPR